MGLFLSFLERGRYFCKRVREREGWRERERERERETGDAGRDWQRTQSNVILTFS